MKFEKTQLALYAITDRYGADEDTLLKKIDGALKSGVTMLQLREKNLPFEKFLEEAKRVKKITDKYNVPLIINDNVDIAKLSGADGVHVGQSDMAVENAREILGENSIIGATAKTVEQAQNAERAGATYIGVGAVFGSTTKLDAKTITLDTLREVVNSVNIPSVAIGGINRDNIHKLKNTGISGVAVVSAIFATDSPTISFAPQL